MVTRPQLEQLQSLPVWEELMQLVQEQIDMRKDLILHRPYHEAEDPQNAAFYTEFIRGEIAMAETFKVLPQTLIQEVPAPDPDADEDTEQGYDVTSYDEEDDR